MIVAIGRKTCNLRSRCADRRIRPLLAGRRVELPALKLTMTDTAEDAWGSQSRPRSSEAADCPSND